MRTLPAGKLDAAQTSEAALLLRRALDVDAAIKLGLRIGFDQISADEILAILTIENERDEFDRTFRARDGFARK
ncbi:MAG: hypothetical protein LC114_03050 [Bryobacterales bacterium]|nr:hypothetical protein [Bryobacterales bacterium]